MPAVFVHGVPDTQQVWDAVIALLPTSFIGAFPVGAGGATAG
jgi:hypothetical protein